MHTGELRPRSLPSSRYAVHGELDTVGVPGDGQLRFGVFTRAAAIVIDRRDQVPFGLDQVQR